MHPKCQQQSQVWLYVGVYNVGLRLGWGAPIHDVSTDRTEQRLSSEIATVCIS